MDKKREQVFRRIWKQSGFAGCSVRRSPPRPGRDKALDKVKEPPCTSRSLGGGGGGGKRNAAAPSIFM